MCLRRAWRFFLQRADSKDTTYANFWVDHISVVCRKSIAVYSLYLGIAFIFPLLHSPVHTSARQIIFLFLHLFSVYFVSFRRSPVSQSVGFFLDFPFSSAIFFLSFISSFSCNRMACDCILYTNVTG